MDRPIGLFDSGFGGLTVMKEFIRLLPHEDLIYLGDTARLPYGNKSPQTVLQFALENASFLLEQKIKMLIIPCHTACSHGLEILQKTLPIPVLGMIQPGLELLPRGSNIAVLGTTSTIESGIYQTLIKEINPTAKIFAQACPLFVPLIEEGFYNHLSASLIAESYLRPLKGKVDTVLLACTHYPLIKTTLQKILGPQVKLVEPAERCALQAYDILSKANLLNPQRKKPHYQFFVSDDPEKFRKLGQVFLGMPIETVVKNKNL